MQNLSPQISLMYTKCTATIAAKIDPKAIEKICKLLQLLKGTGILKNFSG